MDINDITGAIIGAAMRVHSALGPGLLEHDLPVIYDGVQVNLGYKIDMLVEEAVIVELKCVEAFRPLHEAQLISYLKLSTKNVGLLINFHVAHTRDGIKRLVYGRGWDKPCYLSVAPVVKKN